MSTEGPKKLVKPKPEAAVPSKELSREELVASLEEARRELEQSKAAQAALEAERTGLKREITDLKLTNEGLKSTSSKANKESGVNELQLEVEKKLLTPEAKIRNLEIIVANCEKALSEAHPNALIAYSNILEQMTSAEGEVQTLVSVIKDKTHFWERKKREASKIAKDRLEEIRVGLKNKISEVNEDFNGVPSFPVGQNGYDVVLDTSKISIGYFVNMGADGLAEFHSPQDAATLRDLKSKLPANSEALASSRRRVDALIERVSSVKAHLNGLKGLYDEYIRSQPEVFEKRNKVEAKVNEFFRNLS